MLLNSDANVTVENVAFVIRLLKSPVGVTMTRHNRERWAVILKFRGKTFYTVNGKQILSDERHPIIIPKGCSYSWKCTEPGECIIIEFNAREKYPDVFSFNVSDSSYIVNTFKKIEKSLNSQNAECKFECNYLLYGILLFLARSEKNDYVSKDKRTLIKTAVDYISEKYYECNITNDLLAETCGISTVYFRQVFEKVYGVSPIKYLHNFRIEKARAILKSDFESIGQVAESVGYNSIYHFSKMFKVYTGMSPSEYVKTSEK